MDAIPVSAERLKGKNQCRFCRWFASWSDLEPAPWEYEEWVEQPDGTQRRVTVTVPAFAHIGAKDEELGYFGGSLRSCEARQKPNDARRARPRCPDCGHGRPEGHHGRTCQFPERYQGYFDQYPEYSICGCTYDASKEAKEDAA